MGGNCTMSPQFAPVRFEALQYCQIVWLNGILMEVLGLGTEPAPGPSRPFNGRKFA